MAPAMHPIAPPMSANVMVTGAPITAATPTTAPAPIVAHVPAAATSFVFSLFMSLTF